MFDGLFYLRIYKNLVYKSIDIKLFFNKFTQS